MKNSSLATCYQLAEMIGAEWAENRTPEDIRLSEQAISCFLAVQAAVSVEGGDLNRGDFQRFSPTFVDQFEQVMLRPL